MLARDVHALHPRWRFGGVKQNKQARKKISVPGLHGRSTAHIPALYNLESVAALSGEALERASLAIRRLLYGPITTIGQTFLLSFLFRVFPRTSCLRCSFLYSVRFLVVSRPA